MEMLRVNFKLQRVSEQQAIIVERAAVTASGWGGRGGGGGGGGGVSLVPRWSCFYEAHLYVWHIIKHYARSMRDARPRGRSAQRYVSISFFFFPPRATKFISYSAYLRSSIRCAPSRGLLRPYAFRAHKLCRRRRSAVVWSPGVRREGLAADGWPRRPS